MAVTTLIDLAVGDEIKIKRNLAHPANMARGPFDEYEGTFPWILDPAMAAQQDLGRGVITERRRKPAWGDYPATTAVRVSNSFWYDCADGLQSGSGGTFIELI